MRVSNTRLRGTAGSFLPGPDSRRYRARSRARQPTEQELERLKRNATFKQLVHACVHKMGGLPMLVEWARENPGQFYNIAARLIPVEHAAEAGGSAQMALLIIPPKRLQQPDEDLLQEAERIEDRLSLPAKNGDD
jgi:hypothetical protein